MVHLISVTKYRRKLLIGNFRNDIKQSLSDIRNWSHWYVRRMETDQDHIHILLTYNPTYSVTRIVSTLKQQSTYHAWKSHSSYLARYYRKERALWSDGYFAASVGMASCDTIERYIENQG